jgi:exonuclease SbcD
MKFLHAADIHLDSPMAGLPHYPGAPTEQVRNATRQAFKNMIDLALARAVDFVVIAGDLYDGDWKSYDTGLVFREQMIRLGDASIPVYIVLGNHDAASVITKKLSLPDNVHVFPHRKASTELLPDLRVAIHGQSFARRDVYEDISAEYPVPKDGLFNIGLLHTAADGREGHVPYAPCSTAALAARGYDYWALGHVHQREVLNDSPVILFPGNLQGRHIRETAPLGKGCTIVEVDEAHRIELEHVAVDVVRWAHLEVDVAGFESTDAVLAKVEDTLRRAHDTCDGRVLAARLTLVGETALHGRLIGDFDDLLSEVRARGLDIALDQVWIENIKINTRSVVSTQDLRERQDTLGDVVRALQASGRDPVIQTRLHTELAALFDKLGLEASERFPELTALKDGESLDELIERASDLVIASLSRQEPS